MVQVRNLNIFIFYLHEHLYQTTVGNPADLYLFDWNIATIDTHIIYVRNTNVTQNKFTHQMRDDNDTQNFTLHYRHIFATCLGM